MTESAPPTPAIAVSASPAEPSLMDRFNQEAVIYGALHSVIDPELQIDVVELQLIRQIEVSASKVDVRMVLTTPFCPWGPALLEEIRVKVEEATGLPTEVHLLAERWEMPEELRLVW